MRSPNINYLWAELIIEELTRCGVRRFCISPGSRNSPLVIAAAENQAAETLVHPDERGAAFFAAGYAKATGEPAALICTSGTAVANYLPAVVEASMSAVPLIALSADRPAELRETASNQTIDQIRIYGRYVKWSFDLPSPSPKIPAEFVLTTVDQAVYRARRAPEGPVQLNCMIPEPLAPEVDDFIPNGYTDRIEHWRHQNKPFTNYLPVGLSADDFSLETVRKALRNSKSGVIVCGRLVHEDDSDSTYELADSLGMPLLADLSSNLRSASQSAGNLITHYDLFLRDERFLEKSRPDLVLHLGGPVISKALNRYMEDVRVEHIVVDRTPNRQDPGHSVSLRVEMEPSGFCKRISGMSSGECSSLLAPFRRADAICRDLLGKLEPVRCLSNGFSVAYHLLGALPSDCGLILANSMPVRDADGCGRALPGSVHVGVNRGASGIDGNIATAAGFADGLARRSVLLIGDLAFVHDINSLLLVKNSSLPLTIVLFNDDGGGMFSFLPIAKYDKHFERFFATPHGLDFQGAASLFDLKYFRPETVSGLVECIGEALNLPQSSLIEVKADRERNLAEHQRIWKSVAEALGGSIL